MGYPTIVLLVLDLFQSYSVQYYTSLCGSEKLCFVELGLLCSASSRYFKQATGMYGISCLINR